MEKLRLSCNAKTPENASGVFTLLDELCLLMFFYKTLIQV